MTQHVSHYHSDQIRELHAEIERLKEQVAAAQASSGYTICVAQVEIERLTALVAQQSSKHDADMQAMQLAHNREIERLREPPTWTAWAALLQQRDEQRAEIERWKLTVALREAEIERLRLKVPDRDKLLSEIERLRAALQEIAREQSAKDAVTAADRFQQIARRALEPKP